MSRFCQRGKVQSTSPAQTKNCAFGSEFSQTAIVNVLPIGTLGVIILGASPSFRISMRLAIRPSRAPALARECFSRASQL